MKIELKAALNMDANRVETGYVDVKVNEDVNKQRLTVTETGSNTGIFTGALKVSDFTRRAAFDNRRKTPFHKLIVSYGHLGFEKAASLLIMRS